MHFPIVGSIPDRLWATGKRMDLRIQLFLGGRGRQVRGPSRRALPSPHHPEHRSRHDPLWGADRHSASSSPPGTRLPTPSDPLFRSLQALDPRRQGSDSDLGTGTAKITSLEKRSFGRAMGGASELEALFATATEVNPEPRSLNS